MRNSYKDAFAKKHNLKLGFMSAFVKATAYALQDQPIVNAVIDDNEIIYRDYIDISVAVATPKGLVVPVLRNVNDMNYAQIEQEIADLGEKVNVSSSLSLSPLKLTHSTILSLSPRLATTLSPSKTWTEVLSPSAMAACLAPCSALPSSTRLNLLFSVCTL